MLDRLGDGPGPRRATRSLLQGGTSICSGRQRPPVAAEAQFALLRRGRGGRGGVARAPALERCQVRPAGAGRGFARRQAGDPRRPRGGVGAHAAAARRQQQRQRRQRWRRRRRAAALLAAEEPGFGVRGGAELRARRPPLARSRQAVVVDLVGSCFLCHCLLRHGCWLCHRTGKVGLLGCRLVTVLAGGPLRYCQSHHDCAISAAGCAGRFAVGLCGGRPRLHSHGLSCRRSRCCRCWLCTAVAARLGRSRRRAAARRLPQLAAAKARAAEPERPVEQAAAHSLRQRLVDGGARRVEAGEAVAGQKRAAGDGAAAAAAAGGGGGGVCIQHDERAERPDRGRRLPPLSRGGRGAGLRGGGRQARERKAPAAAVGLLARERRRRRGAGAAVAGAAVAADAADAAAAAPRGRQHVKGDKVRRLARQRQAHLQRAAVRRGRESAG